MPTTGGEVETQALTDAPSTTPAATTTPASAPAAAQETPVESTPLNEPEAAPAPAEKGLPAQTADKTWTLNAEEQKYKGQLIGPKGSTIKKIQADSGAHVHMDGIELTFDGTDDQIIAARTIVAQILDEAEHPDYCGEEGDRLRAEAQKCYEEQHKISNEATKAFDAGDKGKGAGLIKQSKEMHAKGEEFDHQAAAEILKHRNEGKGDLYMDLHGLHCNEAMAFVQERVEKLQPKSGSGREFELIPGAGNHSAGAAVIKPTIMKWLKEQGLAYDEKNAGTLIVHLDN